jgi:hypothetical protein
VVKSTKLHFERGEQDGKSETGSDKEEDVEGYFVGLSGMWLGGVCG